MILDPKATEEFGNLSDGYESHSDGKLDLTSMSCSQCKVYSEKSR
jgi:hypothetical protein